MVSNMSFAIRWKFIKGLSEIVFIVRSIFDHGWLFSRKGCRRLEESRRNVYAVNSQKFEMSVGSHAMLVE